MMSFSPNNTEPTGAPNPFDKQIEIESKQSPTCFGVSLDSAKALKILDSHSI